MQEQQFLLEIQNLLLVSTLTYLGSSRYTATPASVKRKIKKQGAQEIVLTTQQLKSFLATSSLLALFLFLQMSSLFDM